MVTLSLKKCSYKNKGKNESGSTDKTVTIKKFSQQHVIKAPITIIA